MGQVSNLAENVGYEYIAIGENLALGNFLNDEDLVQAWMDSPGHRENILRKRYQEIGVAVIKGIYEGQNTWIAVQHFGMPLSACPKADSSVKQKIEGNQVVLDQLRSEIEAKKQDLEQEKDRDQKVQQYNALVDEYNKLVAETKSLIENYNNQVRTFNQCAS